MRLSFSLTLAALSLLTPALFADPVSYGNVGTPAPQVPTYATGDSITFYFAGSNAAFTDFLEVEDLNTLFTASMLFNNQTSSVGEQITITEPGQINLDDQIVFSVISPEGVLGNIGALNSDGTNHVYITPYSGPVGGATVTDGLYLGFEDETVPGSDLDYNDTTAIVTGVSTSPAPEPGSLVLLGTGALSAAGFLRRRFTVR